MEIWATPHGFLKAALANNATSQPADGGSEVSFTIDGKHKYIGRINAQNQVERVQTWIDNPVLGDTPVEIDVLGLSRLQRRAVPGADRADAGRLSGARHHRLGGHHESGGRSARCPDAVRSLHAAAGQRRGGETGGRRLLREGRQPSQHRHRSARPHRRRRRAAERGAIGGGDREGEGDHPRTSRSSTWSTRTCTSITRAACAPMWTKARRS